MFHGVIQNMKKSSNYQRHHIATAKAAASLMRTVMKTFMTEKNSEENVSNGDSGHCVHIFGRKIVKKRPILHISVKNAYLNTDIINQSGKHSCEYGQANTAAIGSGAVLDKNFFNTYFSNSPSQTQHFWVEDVQHEVYITSNTSVPVRIILYWVGYTEGSKESVVQLYQDGIIKKYGVRVPAYHFEPMVYPVESMQLRSTTRCYYTKSLFLSPGATAKFKFHRDIFRWFDSAIEDIDTNDYFPGFTETFLCRLVGTPITNDAGTAVTTAKSSLAIVAHSKFRYRKPTGPTPEIQSNIVRSVIPTTTTGANFMEEDTGAKTTLQFF